MNRWKLLDLISTKRRAVWYFRKTNLDFMMVNHHKNNFYAIFDHFKHLCVNVKGDFLRSFCVCAGFPKEFISTCGTFRFLNEFLNNTTTKTPVWVVIYFIMIVVLKSVKLCVYGNIFHKEKNYHRLDQQLWQTNSRSNSSALLGHNEQAFGNVIKLLENLVSSFRD